MNLNAVLARPSCRPNTLISLHRPARWWRLLVICALATLPASAQTFTLLHSFEGNDGANPGFETLAQGRDGNLYGTTSAAGTMSDGTLFRITPQGVLNPLSLDGTHGSAPLAGLVLCTDGRLRGTAELGGSSNQGVVFSLPPLSVAVNFDGSNGSEPAAPLLLGFDGNYYGTTVLGGDNNLGTMFKLSPSGTLTVLHSFAGTAGMPPTPFGLAFGQDHALYGVTSGGGSTNQGTIFRITTSGNFQTIYNFDGVHGAAPAGTLILLDDGNFYGTTLAGGNFTFGTVFRLDPAGGVTVLHSFDGSDGDGPSGGLIQASDGNLYGTTLGGGTQSLGTIFSMTASGSFMVLHNFDLSDGGVPSGLMQHTNGKIYGTTEIGGSADRGTVYSLDMELGPFVAFVVPYARVGSGVQILGTGLTGATAVTFNGVPATRFQILSDTAMGAVVPPGATSGPVQVNTSGGALISNVSLQILP